MNPADSHWHAARLLAQHDRSNERRTRGETFERIRRMLLEALSDDAPSEELRQARGYIETGFLWIAKNYDTRP